MLAHWIRALLHQELMNTPLSPLQNVHLEHPNQSNAVSSLTRSPRCRRVAHEGLFSKPWCPHEFAPYSHQIRASKPRFLLMLPQSSSGFAQACLEARQPIFLASGSLPRILTRESQTQSAGATVVHYLPLLLWPQLSRRRRAFEFMKQSFSLALEATLGGLPWLTHTGGQVLLAAVLKAYFLL